MALEGGDQQIGIEADHQGDDEAPHGLGDGVDCDVPPSGAITGQDQQRNESEGDAEAQHYLAQHQISVVLRPMAITTKAGPW